MILHVCNLDKFIPPFIKFINQEFEGEDHQFWIVGEQNLKQYPVGNTNNVYIGKGTIAGHFCAYMKLIFMLHSAKKIILHGLFNPRVLLVLTFCPWVLKKCYWVLWGGDYLYREHARRDWKYYIKEPFHGFVKKRIKHLITYIPESTEIVKKSYGCNAEWHECLCYPSNVFFNESRPDSRGHRTEKKMLVGNSATQTNRHFETFNLIHPFFSGNVRIYVPLSYGDKTYARHVIDKGYQLFGDNFVPILDFIPRSEYQDFLRDIDIVVFNQNRHQAMGTIINILGLGKTLYMNSNVASWKFLKRLGLDVYCMSEFEDFEIRADSKKNNKIIESYFSIDKLKVQWREIFDQ